jgi:hypothetical protein
MEHLLKGVDAGKARVIEVSHYCSFQIINSYQFIQIASEVAQEEGDGCRVK